MDEGYANAYRIQMDAKTFYEILPDGRYRFRVDHHLINDYNTCPYYFKERHIPDAQGLVWGPKTLSIKIALGSWWSSTMELLYNEMAHKTLPSEHHVYKFASDAWAEHDMEQYKRSEPDIFEKFGGLDGARLMALEYYNAFAKQHFNAWHIVGAELGFGWKDELFLGEDDKIVAYYGGKPDLSIVDQAQRMPMPLDFKTKDSIPGNASVKFKPHPQTAGYIFAIRELMKQIDAQRPYENGVKMTSGLQECTKCIVMVCARFRPIDKLRSGVRQPRFLPVYVNYTADEIEEWRRSVMEKCRRLRDSIERNVWPPNENACHLYYHGCMFRRVHSSPPNIREALLRSDFIKVEPWTPYQVEED